MPHSPFHAPIALCLAAAAVLSCSGARSRGGGSDDGPSASGDGPEQGEAPTGPIERPKGPMTRAEAQRYLLALVNRDRAEHDLEPVKWDGIAAEAGQRHADDMAKNGFTGHFGTDGSVPEERYTAAGGDGLVMENAGCFGDAAPREIDPDPRFTADSVERVQATFMAEKPPADGHRRNILTPWHTSFGAGLTKAKGVDVACMAQEFVDDYGTYDPIPKRAKVGDVITIAGELRSPASVAGAGLSRVEPGKPKKPEELLKIASYPIPPPYVTYFPKGFKTPKVLEVNGNKFSIQVPLDDRGRPGMYGVSVWATFPGSKELRMVSLRTVLVEKGK